MPGTRKGASRLVGMQGEEIYLALPILSCDTSAARKIPLSALKPRDWVGAAEGAEGGLSSSSAGTFVPTLCPGQIAPLPETLVFFGSVK